MERSLIKMIITRQTEEPVTATADSTTGPGPQQNVLEAAPPSGSRANSGLSSADGDQVREQPQGPLDFDGFAIGLEPEKILGAIQFRGSKYFLMKWKNTDDPGKLVHNQVAKERCADLLIKFYEDRFEWTNFNPNDE